MSRTNLPLTNWAGNLTYAASRVHQPESLSELRRLVAGARQIRAFGSRHSFSPVADTTGELVSLHRLPHAVTIDTAGEAVATVAAGMTYVEVAAELQKAGFALANTASLSHISVAGAVATGTHGSGANLPCLSASVVGLRWVGPDGDLVQVRRDTDPERFPGTAVALGALGVVTDVTLALQPAFTMTQHVRVDVALDEVTDRLDEMFAAAYSVSLFTDWRSGTGHVYLKRRTDQTYPALEVGRPADGPVHPVPGLPPDFCTEQMGVPGWWHERLPHFRAEFRPGVGNELQSEYYVPREVAPAAFAALRGLGPLLAPVLHIAEVRSVKGDDLWLSPAYGRDSVTFHFTWVAAETDVLPVMKVVEDALAPMQARPHWAKLTAVSPETVIGRYERAQDFAQLLKVFDPDRKFANPLTEALYPR